MANEITTNATTGSSVYAIIRNGLMNVWNGSGFEAWNASDYSTYIVPLTEQGTSGFFVGSIPAGINTADTLTIEIYSGAGTLGDTFISGGTLNWSGSSIIDDDPIGTALTSLEYVKDYGQITGSTYDTFLQNRINSISVAVESYCRRTFAITTYTESIDGCGSTELLLGQFPVVSVTQVVVDQYGSQPTTIPGSSFIVNTKNGIVSVKPTATYSPWFAYSNQGISVTYQAGYDPIPFDIQEAVAEMVMNQFYKLGTDVTLSQEQIGDYNRTSRADVQQLLTDDIKHTLNHYRQGIV